MAGQAALRPRESSTIARRWRRTGGRSVPRSNPFPTYAVSQTSDSGGSSGAIAERDGGIADPPRINRDGRLDQPPALLQLTRQPHGQHGHKALPGQPARGPVWSLAGIAPDQPVGATVIAHVLQQPPELLGPEVRHGVVTLRRSGQV